MSDKYIYFSINKSENLLNHFVVNNINMTLRLILIFALSLSFCVATNFPRFPFHMRDQQQDPMLDASSAIENKAIEGYIVQNLDNFDTQNSNKINQVYINFSSVFGRNINMPVSTIKEIPSNWPIL